MDKFSEERAAWMRALAEHDAEHRRGCAGREADHLPVSYPPPLVELERAVSEMSVLRAEHLERGGQVDGAWRDRLRFEFEDFPFIADFATTEVGDGWQFLIRAAANIFKSSVLGDDISNYCTLQVKEKYGSLRLDVIANDPCDRWAGVFEHLSLFVCDRCGAPGRLRDGGWMATRCDEHAEGHR